MESLVGEEGGGGSRAGKSLGLDEEQNGETHVHIGGSRTRACPAPRDGTWATRSQCGLTLGLELKIVLTFQRCVTSDAHRQ